MKPQSSAIIHIKDLKVPVIIGTQPHEREMPQELMVNISFEYDASLAAQTDALGHAVDYTAIHARIFEQVPATRFFLLERLAAFIVDIIMEDKKIISAEVVLEKFGVLPGVASVAVRISADRAGQKIVPAVRCC